MYFSTLGSRWNQFERMTGKMDSRVLERSVKFQWNFSPTFDLKKFLNTTRNPKWAQLSNRHDKKKILWVVSAATPKTTAMVQSINIKALTTLASVVRRPYIAAPHVFVPTVSGECSLSFCSRFKAYRPSHLGLFYVMCSTLFPSSSVFLAGSHLIIDICLHWWTGGIGFGL